MAKQILDLVTLGDATIDLFYRVQEDSESCTLDDEKCVVCFGYGDKLPVQSFHRSIAGNSCNAAVGAARLGLKAAFWTVVGNDYAGKEIIDGLKKEGVATALVHRDKKLPTNTHVVLNYDGERTIFVYHQPYAYPAIKLPASRWVYFSSVNERFGPRHAQLLKELKRTGAELAMNPGTYQLKLGLKGLMPFIAGCGAFFVNREEAALLLGMSPKEPIPDMLAAFMKLGTKRVVITDGQAGAFAADAAGTWSVAPFGGDRVEATGAGDSFATALVVALAKGKDLGEALRWGGVNSWSVVSQVGPQAGLLTAAQLAKQLKAHPEYQAKKIS